MRFLILGAGGQDGIIASKLLSLRGDDVLAAVRKLPPQGHPLRTFLQESQIVAVDVHHSGDVRRVLETYRPSRILNLAGQSNVRTSWEDARGSIETNVLGLLHIMQAVRDLRMQDEVRLYQASSSEVFGRPDVEPQNEDVESRPVTPYGASKAAAQHLAEMYRERHGLWVAVGILFNHESVYRSEEYVVRHVTGSVARIHKGIQQTLSIGNLEARRDWGFAPDYVDGMLRMLEYRQPTNFVLATGISHSVDELLQIAFAAAGIGEWRPLLQQDRSRQRVVEPFRLVGDATKARSLLDWRTTCTFSDMVSQLVLHDIEALR